MKQITEQINEKEIPIKVKNFLKEAFGDNLDLIDFKAEIDSSLNSDEIIGHFAQKFSTLFCEEYKEKLKLKDAKEKAIAQKEIQLSEIKKEEKKLIEDWKKTDYKDIDIKSFDIVKNYIQLICRNNSHYGINGILITGETGLGKSYCVINTLKQEKVDFCYLNTWTTALELYKYLFNNNSKIIVFDDVVQLLDNPKNIGILQSALWEVNGKRIITNNTTDKVLEGCPKIFEFTGKIIIISNELKETNEHIKSVKERCLPLELNFTFNEKLKIMKEISKKPYKDTTQQLRDNALNMLISCVDVSTENLNFRSLIRAYECLIFDKSKAKDMLNHTLKINEEWQFVFNLMNSNKSIDEQISEYNLKFNKSRASFFRTKKEIKERLK